MALHILKQMLKAKNLEQLKQNGLTVGAHFAMLDEVDIDPSHTWLITIGDEVTLAPRVQILAHDASTKHHLGMTILGKVTIGNRVFIGASSIIMPGVTIGDNVIIGAGSIVTKDIPSRCVAAGNPARVRCTLEEFMKRRKEELADLPQFGREYTLAGQISEEQKAEMKTRIKMFGYII